MTLIQPPNFELLRTHSDWRTTWTHVLAGQFTAGAYSSLLFYEQSTGHAEFYEADGEGGIVPFRQHDGWPTSWDIIVPGYFHASSFLPESRQPANTGLLFYDRAAGFGAIYDTNGDGVLRKLAEYDDWRTTWTHIVAGTFTESPFSGLLFYDAASGYAELYETDGFGGLSPGPIQTYQWRKNWTHLVPGEFANDGSIYEPVITDLFFYDSVRRFSATYANDGNGVFTAVQHPGPPEQPLRGPNAPPATMVLPGSFGGTEYTNLLFYDRPAGTGRFLHLNASAWSISEEYADWRQSWDIIVPGNFWMADPDQDIWFPDGGFTDLLFYDREQGVGEFYLHEPPQPTVVQPFAGYASARSVFPGEAICFHVASQVGPYQIRVYRKGLHDVAMADLDVTPADPLPISRLAYRDGAGWPPVAELTIPVTWPSGLYVARVYAPVVPTTSTSGEMFTTARRLPPESLEIPFVVRPARPGQRARILLVIPDTTYEAYNFWGGRSLYGYGHHGTFAWAYPQTAFRVPYAFRVSFLRPHSAAGTSANKWQHYELPLIRWIERQSILVEYCTASDLDGADALEVLRSYNLVLTVGHSEYWSHGMKGNVQSYIEQGGNAAFLGGNICYWQIRFEDRGLGPEIVCYKQKAFDPVSSDPQQKPTVTILWRDVPGNSDYRLTGVSYGWAQYPAFPQFEVCEPSHWVFANTGLVLGSPFGSYAGDQGTIAGPETDRRSNDTPESFVLLAIDRDIAGDEVGSMGVMVNGGTVFVAAATEWTLGLSQEGSWGPIDQVTRNVLIRLG